MVTARRWWNRSSTTDEGVATMGNDWDARTPIVSNLGQPRISPRETRRPGEPPTDYELAAAEQKVDAALDEGERNRRLLAEAERLYRVAFTEVEQRALVLHELAGLDEAQQVDELRTLETLITVALGRHQVLKARRGGIGLYRQMTGKPLPPYATMREAREQTRQEEAGELPPSVDLTRRTEGEQS